MHFYIWKTATESGLVMQSNATTEFKSSPKTVVNSTPEPSYIIPDVDNIPTIFQSGKQSNEETNDKFTQVDIGPIVGKSEEKSNEKSTRELSHAKNDHRPTEVVNNDIITQVVSLEEPSTSYAEISPTSNGSHALVYKESPADQPRRTQSERKRNIDYTSGDEDDPPTKDKTRQLTDCSDSSSVSGSQFRDRRDRNKVASRKFRQNRKQRDAARRVQETQLQKQNEVLKMKVNELEKNLQSLKAVLFKSMDKDKES